MKSVTKILIAILFSIQLISARQNDNCKIALLMSSEESFVNKENEKQILDQITAWELMLMDHKIKYDVISVDEIDELSPEEYGCLVVATDLYLDENGWFSFQDKLNEFGKLLIAAAIQVNDDDTRLTNREVISKLTGLTIISSETKSYKNIVQVISGQTQLTQGIESGSKLQLSGNKELFFADNLVTAQHNIGYMEYWSDNILLNETQESAIIYGNKETTKFIWFGFDQTDLIGGENDITSFYKLINNSVDWLNGKQYSAFGRWQSGINSAFVFSPVINGRSDLTEKIIPLLSANKITADFLITENAIGDTGLIQKLSLYGNFGFVVNDLENNINRTLSCLNDLQQSTGKKIEYLATGNLNSAVKFKKELLNAGINTLILYNYQESKIPFYLDDEKDLLVIPAAYIKLGDEKDFQLLSSDDLIYNEVFKDAVNYLMADITFCESKAEKNLNNYLKEIKDNQTNKNLFITSSKNISEWYERKSNILIHTSTSGTSEYEIEIRNGNDEPVENLMLVFADSKITVEPLLFEYGKISSINFEYDKQGNEIKMLIDYLKAYENRKIKISLNNSL